ncbi:F-box protein [Medicago truncatula]|uniref:F-box protein n=1 Tax=Medicago truncatula TaxID=3880 RepID=G7L7K9_MEDTR|nr:F-box protein [Medicago truncatula]
MTTTIAASSVELRHLICNNNNNLWRNICTSKWPSLMDPIVNDVISTFPGGYSSFFSDAFPSLHHHTNSHRSYPPPPELIHAIDICIYMENMSFPEF